MFKTRSTVTALAAILLMVASTAVQASPLGTDYSVLLDAFLLTTDDNGDDVTDTEGHLAFDTGDILFDGNFDLLVNDLVPDPPFAAGNDLQVTETVTPMGENWEQIDIWVLGDENDDTATLFNNTALFDPDGLVLFEISDLFWGNNPNGLGPEGVTDIQVFISFGDILVPTNPVDIGIFGDGTQDIPLFISLGLDPAAFLDPNNAPATDLHLSFKVHHGGNGVPEPVSATLGLMGIAALATGLRRRRIA